MNINITSSMKYIDLEGLTPLQIIQKYEELLFQRENIIQQLSNQLNDSQQKYIEVSETIEILSNKNKELNETKLKCDKTLNQQRTDKDLLFIKLNNLISENDKLTNLITGKKEPKINSQPEYNTNIKKIEKNKYKEKEKEKDIIKKENQINNNNNMKLELKKEEIKTNQPKININKNNKEEIKKDIKDNINTISTSSRNIEKKDKNKEDTKKNENEKNEKIKDEIKNEKKDDNININNEIKEEKEKEKEKKEEIKNEEKKEDKFDDKKEDKKEENKNNDKKEEVNPQSEKKIITINPEEYLAKRRKKKNKGGKKLLSEKISYEPVFK